MKTVIVQIGNSDNKLTQEEWSRYVADVKYFISVNVHKIHFCGGSSWDSIWQNACWVFEIEDDTQLKFVLTKCREQWRQDSVAYTVGETSFI